MQNNPDSGKKATGKSRASDRLEAKLQQGTTGKGSEKRRLDSPFELEFL